MLAMTLTFMPWAVPMVAEFYGSNGAGMPVKVVA